VGRLGFCETHFHRNNSDFCVAAIDWSDGCGEAPLRTKDECSKPKTRTFFKDQCLRLQFLMLFKVPNGVVVGGTDDLGSSSSVSSSLILGSRCVLALRGVVVVLGPWRASQDNRWSTENAFEFFIFFTLV